MTPEEAQITILANGFERTHETKKVVEYRSKQNSRVLYLRLGQGFPKQADVVVHPDTESSSLRSLPEIKEHKNVLRYSSNMRLFPEQINEGKAPENYGKAFHALTVQALAGFCKAYGR